MSTERDELAEIISEHYHAANPRPTILDGHIAEAILAAGYRKPRTVTTAAELDALPVESVVMTIGRGQRVGKIKRASDGKMIVWAVIGDNIAAMNRLVAENLLPATVLHEATP